MESPLIIEISDSDYSSDEENQEQNEEEKKDEEKGEDRTLILLCAMRKKTKWRFPNTTICPHLGCRVPFEYSSETIEHFLKTHVLTAIWCSICRSTVSAKYYAGHFKRFHRDRPLPPNWRHILQRYTCKVCGAQVSVEHFKQHVEEKHTAPIVRCPSDACSYRTRRVRSIKLHWAKHHSDQSFPDSWDKK